MERVLDVYSRPFNPKLPVICMDESPKQLIKETRTRIMARPGSLEKYDYDYERCGVCSVFMANEPLVGNRYVSVTERRTKRGRQNIVTRYYMEISKCDVENY